MGNGTRSCDYELAQKRDPPQKKCSFIMLSPFNLREKLVSENALFMQGMYMMVTILGPGRLVVAERGEGLPALLQRQN